MWTGVSPKSKVYNPHLNQLIPVCLVTQMNFFFNERGDSTSMQGWDNTDWMIGLDVRRISNGVRISPWKSPSPIVYIPSLHADKPGYQCTTSLSSLGKDRMSKIIIIIIIRNDNLLSWMVYEARLGFLAKLCGDYISASLGLTNSPLSLTYTEASDWSYAHTVRMLYKL